MIINEKIIAFALFSTIFLLIANFHIVRTSLRGLRQPREPFTAIQDEKLSQYVFNKTRITLKAIYLINSDIPFGGMTGLPSKPIMTISRGMYDSFSQQELHYVVLHEVGHLTHLHPVKDALIQLLVLLLAILALRPLPASGSIILGSVLLAFVLGILQVQVAKTFEWEADTYALQRLDDSSEMITATEKLRDAWKGSPDDSILRFLFNRSIPYSQRLKFAKEFPGGFHPLEGNSLFLKNLPG